MSGDQVMLLATYGTCLWEHPPPAPWSSPQIVIDPAGAGVYLLDSFGGTIDAGCGSMTANPAGSTYVVKLSTTGACVWSRSFTAPSYTFSVFPSGDALVSTLFSNTTPTPVDMGSGPIASIGAKGSTNLELVVARLGPSGPPAWVKHFGAAGVSMTGTATADATGAVVLSGTTPGTVSLGGAPLTSGDYVARLDGSGAFLWQRVFSKVIAATPDPCGAVIVGGPCASCSAGAPAATITKLAP
jgi:hypothetical protein